MMTSRATKWFVAFVLAVTATEAVAADCNVPSPTTASGTKAPAGPFCPGDLIFADEFDTFDLRTWQHEITAGGGGNWEFEYYTNNRSNSYVENGKLTIHPTLTADEYGEEFLKNGELSLLGGSPADECTNPAWYGCQRSGTASTTINPVKSARIRSLFSFNFKYGKVQVRAKVPGGDWIWPAIWMLPRDNVYSSWPASGEIDIAEVRGNKNLVKNGVNIGAEQLGCTLHFGPNWNYNSWEYATFARNTEPGRGYNTDFHVYELEWTPDYIKFRFDGEEVGTIDPGTGFWEHAQLGSRAAGVQNPWRYGTKMAPFDQEFYIIMNVAVGGVNFFPDDATNPSPKPWKNDEQDAMYSFWRGRNDWLPTWNAEGGTAADLVVDYVRVYAI